jgi:hypothetical protein
MKLRRTQVILILLRSAIFSFLVFAILRHSRIQIQGKLPCRIWMIRCFRDFGITPVRSAP